MKLFTRRAFSFLFFVMICPSAFALNVLVSNDDGYGTYGIKAMQTALTELGHTVYVVAPATQQSGKSGGMNTNIGQPVGYTVKVAGSEWAVEGTPADSVNAGLNGLLASKQIDLVVTGANEGENVGRLTNGSGTLGAAMYALRRGIPAIAVSVAADIPRLTQLMALKPKFDAAVAANDKASMAKLGAQLGQLKAEMDKGQHRAADFAGDVLKRVMTELGEQGLSKGLALNINVPASAGKDGVTTPLRVVQSDNATMVDLKIIADESEDAAEPTLKLDVAIDQQLAAASSGKASCKDLGLDLNSEGAALACGIGTIAVFDGNFDANNNLAQEAQDLACRLSGIALVETVDCAN